MVSNSLKILQPFKECLPVLGHYVLNEQHVSNDKTSNEIDNNNAIM